MFVIASGKHYINTTKHVGLY